MKATLLLFITLSLSLSPYKPAHALGTMDFTPSNYEQASVSQTAQEEAEGNDVWDKLKSKELSCNNLNDDNFEVLGEYYMGQSLGSTERHNAMNQMMKNMMGDQGETQMHVALGKRYSGCDTSAPFPEGGTGFIGSMLGMMGGGGNRMMGWGWDNMMGWGGMGLLSWIPMLILWVLILLGIFVLFRYMGRSNGEGSKDKSPLDILKERYARGEINKQEFEETKKDLV